LIERVRVIGFVADEPGGELVEEAAGKNVFHKLALGRRSAFDRYGERKTVISGDSDDLRTLATTGGTDGEAPFWALAKVAFTNASSRFSLPCSCKRAASSRSASSNLPLRTHCWNRRRQVWKGGYLSGSSRHCAPVPSTHSTPFSTARVSCHGRSRLSARRAPRKNRLGDQPLFIVQLPASCHSAFAGSHRAISECTIFQPQRFMRLVLVCAAISVEVRINIAR
jgi:hypothetical protein